MRSRRQPLCIGTQTLGRRVLLQRFALTVAGVVALARPTIVSAQRTPPTPTPTPSPQPTVRPTFTPIPTPTPLPEPRQQAWVQALRTLPLWSGPDDNAEHHTTAEALDCRGMPQANSGVDTRGSESGVSISDACRESDD